MFRHPDFTNQDGTPLYTDIMSGLSLPVDLAFGRIPLFYRLVFLYIILPLLSCYFAVQASTAEGLHKSILLESAAGIALFVIASLLLPRLGKSKMLLILSIFVVLFAAYGVTITYHVDVVQTLLLELCVGMSLLVFLEFIFRRHLIEVRKSVEEFLEKHKIRFKETMNLSRLWHSTCEDLYEKVKTNSSEEDQYNKDEDLDPEVVSYAAGIIVNVYKELSGSNPDRKEIVKFIRRKYMDVSDYDLGYEAFQEILGSKQIMSEITDRIYDFLSKHAGHEPNKQMNSVDLI